MSHKLAKLNETSMQEEFEDFILERNQKKSRELC